MKNPAALFLGLVLVAAGSGVVVATAPPDEPGPYRLLRSGFSPGAAVQCASEYSALTNFGVPLVSKHPVEGDLVVALGHAVFGLESSPCRVPSDVDDDAHYRLSVTSEPNPARGRASVAFSFSGSDFEQAHARVEIFDLTGRLVTRLFDGEIPAAGQNVSWDGKDRSGHDVKSGVYFVRMTCKDRSITRSMTLLR